MGSAAELDAAELEQAFSTRTKAIVINTPNNPMGSVPRAELEHIGALCRSGTWSRSPTKSTSMVYDG
jgi:aspartate/methionine/tyrosine aminotransferase